MSYQPYAMTAPPGVPIVSPYPQAGYVTPQMWGALADNSHDDGPAIQSAITYAIANEVAVYFPGSATSYNVGAPLSITSPVTLVGAGMYQVFLKAIGFSVGQFLIDADGGAGIENVEISGMTLASDNNLPDLLRINNCSNSLFRNIGIRSCRRGLVITGNRCFSNEYDRIVALTAVSGNTVRFDAYTGGGQHTFTHCNFYGDIGFVVTTDSEIAGGPTLIHPNFEGCVTNDFTCTGSMFGCTIIGIRTEAGGGNSILLRPEAGKVVAGFFLSGGNMGTTSGASAVVLGGAAGVVAGVKISAVIASGFSTNFVNYNGGGEGTEISNCVIYAGITNIVSALRLGTLVVNNRNEAGAARGPQWNPPLTIAQITGALSAVADPPVQQILTDLIAAGNNALPGTGLWDDATT